MVVAALVEPSRQPTKLQVEAAAVLASLAVLVGQLETEAITQALRGLRKPEGLGARQAQVRLKAEAAVAIRGRLAKALAADRS